VNIYSERVRREQERTLIWERRKRAAVFLGLFSASASIVVAIIWAFVHLILQLT
jgi:hypothetical protein